MASEARNKVPIALSVLFVAGIATLTVANTAGLAGFSRGLAWAFAVCYLGWLVVESRVALGEAKREPTRLDRGTCELYAFCRAATTLACLGLPSMVPESSLVRGVGFALFLAGVGFRLHAIRTLGVFYSHRVRLQAEHQVVQSGPYAFVRHPAYTGMLLAHLGAVVLFGSLVGAALWLLLFVPAVVLRIRVEEGALLQLTGYPEYAATRKRLLPGVW